MEQELTLNESVREAITIALLKLMRKKDFSNIKVTEIVKLAGVGRTSFYRNFESREDVLKKHINKLYYDYFSTHNVPGIESTEDEKREYMLSRFRFVKRNADFFVLLNKNGLIYEIFEGIDNVTLEKIATCDIKNRYFKKFMSSACVGVIIEWIERKFKESEEELADIFMKVKMQ
ncbi:MAG: TetR/AcrR family transcriptional regulator [Oscillospiraceae bacterium]|nr:TetR/AcrR family transcriptional regulator [Oscillospiraceae bacterium]MBQ3237329.1 TetR/AcrR family transcriptional regulator [Oscillospiraceae bacterium]MBQ3561786.1 TetR/AcrR family transcriptional regulator [Oscillospiraceae bacterium]MBQ6699371.1 TetR/AcrR family transcriptional regulator [Oscillospiraceae bacterium]MBQ6801539.1 TetR/AcrR family transcriptional regulator [Oscillospiraceae bacterium]